MIGWILLIPIIFPVIAGLFVFRTKTRKSMRSLVSAIVIINAALVIGLAFIPDLSFDVWSISDTMLITFKQDVMSKFFAVLVSAIWVLVAFFAYEYITHEGKESLFLGFYTMTIGVYSFLFVVF